MVYTLTLFDLQDDVAEAQPEIDMRTAQIVSKGRWGVNGYKARTELITGFTGVLTMSQEKFGDLAVM